MLGTLQIKDRTFEVSNARMRSRCHGLWYLEIHTKDLELDDQRWEPQILHEGLQLGTDVLADLHGKSTSWESPYANDYPHPEICSFYVFSHHDIHHCTLRFTQTPAGLRLHWEGQCDVYWDDDYSKNLPFLCDLILPNSSAPASNPAKDLKR